MPSSQEDDRRRRAEEWFKRGDADLDRENIPAALHSFQGSLKLSQQLNDGSLISRNLWKLADVHLLRLQDNERGLAFAEGALSVARAAGDRQQEARALDQVGNAYFNLSNFAKALDSFRAALAIMRQIGDRFGEATALKDAGITYRFSGRFDDALGYLHEALEIFRQLGATNAYLSTLENIGMVYSSLGEYPFAIDAYQQALKIGRENMDSEAIYGALTRIGMLYLDHSNPEPALNYFKQALGVLEKPRRDPWLLRGMGWALLEVGQKDAAIETFRQSLNLSRQLKDEGGIANDFWGLGQLYLERDPVVAITYLRQALATLEKLGFELTWGIYASLAQAYLRQGDLDRAIESYQEAIDRFESVRGRLASEQSRAGLMGQHHQIYQEMIAALMERHVQIPQGGDDIRAFAVFEQAKARAMVEAITQSRLDIQRDVEPHLWQQYQQIGARIAELQRRLRDSALTTAKRQPILEELTEAEQESDRLVSEFKRRDPQYAALRYPEPLSLKRAQALLDEHTAFVAYLITRDQVFFFF